MLNVEDTAMKTTGPPSQFSLQTSSLFIVPPISGRGNINEIMSRFGGADNLRNAVNQLQLLLYAT